MPHDNDAPAAPTPCALCNAYQKLFISKRATTPVPPRDAQHLFALGYWVCRSRKEGEKERFCEPHGELLHKIQEEHEEEQRAIAAAKQRQNEEEYRRIHAARIASEAAAEAVAREVSRQNAE